MYVRSDFGSSRPFVAYGGLGGNCESKSTCPTPGVTRDSPCLLRAESKSCHDGNQEVWGGLQPLYLLFLLGSLWDHFAPGVPHQGPWCTSPGQWLSWPKGDGVKCSRSEGPRRESRSEINETHHFITCRSFEGRPWYSPIAMIRRTVIVLVHILCRNITACRPGTRQVQ